MLRDTSLLQKQQRTRVITNLVKQVRKIGGEISKLNRYMQSSGEDMERLERESKLVRRIKPLLSQRSFSIDKLSAVDLNLIPQAEKTQWCHIIDAEKAKIRAYL